MRPEILAMREKTRKSLLLVLCISLATVAVVLISFSASTVDIGIAESFRIISDHLAGIVPSDFKTYLKDEIVFSDNIPRAIGAVIAGCVLSVSGAVLQNLIRNPLADPYTLGISSGAMFGMVLSVGLGVNIIPWISTSDGMMVNAFLFSMLPTVVVILVAMFKKVTPTMMILCGIAMMYVFTAFTTLIKYSVEPETLSMIYQWSIGSVSGLSWGSMPKMILAVFLVIIPVSILHRRIDIVAQGDESAISLGIRPNLLRIVCLCFITVGTSVVVCYTGTIGFVGLVAPHIARIFVGNQCKILLPASAAVGALMLIASDYIVREIAPTLPVGVILALICSPIFIIILLRIRKTSW